MQFRRSQIGNGALMRVRNLSNSVKRNDKKNTVNSWRLGNKSNFIWTGKEFFWTARH